MTSPTTRWSFITRCDSLSLRAASLARNCRLPLTSVRSRSASLLFALLCSFAFSFLVTRVRAQGVWHFEGLLSLCTALKANSCLKLLNLSNNLIGPEGASKLVDALKGNESLTSLDVSSNKLGQDGALHFANLLVVKWEKIELERGRGRGIRSPGIVSLNLASNFIGLQGENSIMALAAAVEVNKCLKKINLENNASGRHALGHHPQVKDRVHV